MQLLSKKTLYKGFFHLAAYTFKHKLFAGGWSKEVVREMYQRSDAVAVLPFDVQRNELVLIEQLRIGAIESEHSPWLLECIAGMIDEGEQADDVVRREAMEEAGLTFGRLHKALSYYSSPGGTTERLHIYIAEVDASTAKGIHGLVDEHEDILVHRINLDDAYTLLEQGKIDNASTVIALQWLALNKAKLIDQWSV
ncbi:ADP-ribose diphosphatase [Alteromonadaceae bacterium BrNp21-10]|nr:ADP-ribose diphosphatase [Alteromonadaceae bacterium BrNp21-10]